MWDWSHLLGSSVAIANRNDQAEARRSPQMSPLRRTLGRIATHRGACRRERVPIRPVAAPQRDAKRALSKRRRVVWLVRSSGAIVVERVAPIVSDN
jgi:hypothetical protein